MTNVVDIPNVKFPFYQNCWYCECTYSCSPSDFNWTNEFCKFYTICPLCGTNNFILKIPMIMVKVENE
jgi:hypothetical protein